jgi:hypothetical protein
MKQQNQGSVILHKGDEVLWSGAWGNDSPHPAKITNIVLVENPGSLEGSSVEAVQWSACKGSNVIVDLDNGHWAYGYQISKKGTANG